MCFLASAANRTPVAVPTQPPTNGIVLPTLRRTPSSIKLEHNDTKTKTESDKTNESHETRNNNTVKTEPETLLKKPLSVTVPESGDVKIETLPPAQPVSMNSSTGKESEAAALAARYV